MKEDVMNDEERYGRFNERECGCYDAGDIEYRIPDRTVMCEKHWLDFEAIFECDDCD